MSTFRAAQGQSNDQPGNRTREQGAAALHSRPALGFLSAYVPEELFHAAGFTPVFLFHTTENRGRARAHLPGFTCWIARSALDQALAGDLDGLAGLAIAQTCDTMQGLTDVWRRIVEHTPFFHFGMPLRLESPSARAYLLAELRSLHARLEAHVGHPISWESLHESIVLYNRTRAVVRRLYPHATEFAPSDLYDLVRAAFQMPKEAYNQEAEGRMQGARNKIQASSSLPSRLSAPLLVVVGPALGDPALFDVIGQAGARVVGDLLDLGERYFAVDAAEDGDPLEALADQLLALTPTPTKYDPQHRRANRLLALVRERGAHGVIFARQKFCEPHGFDHVQLARALDRASVPHLTVELEQASQIGRLSTRIEAFLEMVGQ